MTSTTRIKAGALALGTVAMLVTACTTINPYTREEQTSKAAKGALIGAATGAVVGLISGDDSMERKQRALIGAGVGALVYTGHMVYTLFRAHS